MLYIDGLYNFSATSISVSPADNTLGLLEMKQLFGEGVRSVKIPKSKAHLIMAEIERRGISWDADNEHAA